VQYLYINLFLWYPPNPPQNDSEQEIDGPERSKPMKTTPAFNLNVVIRETGIKPDTLRAWERRYGLPQPARSEGGHRLYSERDIGTVHWLIERLEEGLRIKQAVDLWKDLESSGQDPLLIKPTKPQPYLADGGLIRESPSLMDMRNEWVNACMNFDEASAESITNYGFALYPLLTVCFDLLLGGLADIGEAWYKGVASVQQEHFATSLVTRRLNALITASPPPTRTGTILVACSPGDDHTIPALMLTLMFRQQGWRVVYLGANVPKLQFKETIQAVKPVITILTAQHLIAAASLLDLAEYLTQKGLRVAFGGLIFNRNPELTSKIPGYFLGDQLRNAPQKLGEILSVTSPIPETTQRSEVYSSVLELFNEVRSKIEIEVEEYLAEKNIHPEHVTLASHFLSENIEAALKFGNLDLIGSELYWVDHLIENYIPQSETLNLYLLAYHKAIINIMDQRGEPLIQWFTEQLEKAT
jgi:methanogenic corrinoid protein MtbC1